LCVTGNIKTEGSYYVDGVQVVSNQWATPIPPTNGNLVSTSDTCNLILQVLRSHGLLNPSLGPP
jgi:hypothetical protein